MEEPRKWTLAVVVVAIAGVIIFAIVGYALVDQDEEEVPPDHVISIDGSDLSSSELVDSGSGTAVDPYIITDLDVEVVTAVSSYPRSGIAVWNVSAHLIISGVTVRPIDGPPVLGYSTVAGIVITDSENVTILDCDFEDLTIGVMVEGSEHINVTECRFTSCEFGVLVTHVLGRSGDLMVINNDFTKCGTCLRTDTYFIYQTVNGVSGITVEGNYFVDSEMATSTPHAADVVISNNFALSMTSEVFALSWVKHAIVANNSINCLGDAVSVYASDDIDITGNDISPVGGGIVASCSTNLSIAMNTVLGGVYGMHLHGINTGVWIEACTGVNITYNEILNNVVGVALISSDNGNTTAIVHHNEIAGIGVHAIDNAGTSGQWDDGIGEGNYWGDYYGLDGDSDGIGDTPYEIDADSEDRYPLVKSPV